jgi:RluA family pseudouridine synthase
MKNWIVTKEESGIKLIEFLKNKLGASVSIRQIKKALDDNHCKINQRVERFGSFTLGLGDKVLFADIQIDAKETAPLIFELDRCLFDDQDFLIYNKPSNIPSDSPLLLKTLQRDLPYLVLTHRLDRDTTGALVFAKNKDALHVLSDLFKNRQVSKQYLAIVDGIPKQSRGKIDNFIGPLKRYQGQTIHGELPPPHGLQAITHWHLEKAGKDCSLIQCSPKTGRTHQIRVHLSGINHPILGDFQYGKHFKCTYRPNRYLLHAEMIAFTNPRNGQEIRVQAPLSSDFKIAINQLFNRPLA